MQYRGYDVDVKTLAKPDDHGNRYLLVVQKDGQVLEAKPCYSIAEANMMRSVVVAKLIDEKPAKNEHERKANHPFKKAVSATAKKPRKQSTKKPAKKAAKKTAPKKGRKVTKPTVPRHKKETDEPVTLPQPSKVAAQAAHMLNQASAGVFRNKGRTYFRTLDGSTSPYTER